MWCLSIRALDNQSSYTSFSKTSDMSLQRLNIQGLIFEKESHHWRIDSARGTSWSHDDKSLDNCKGLQNADRNIDTLVFHATIRPYTGDIILYKDQLSRWWILLPYPVSLGRPLVLPNLVIYYDNSAKVDKGLLPLELGPRISRGYVQ